MKKVLILSILILGCDKDSPVAPTTCDEGYIKPDTSEDYWKQECYFEGDVAVLDSFIVRSLETINYEIEFDFSKNDKIEWWELGHQDWENGRLTKFYSSYTENKIDYDCNLSGFIPSNIENLTELIGLYSYRDNFSG